MKKRGFPFGILTSAPRKKIKSKIGKNLLLRELQNADCIAISEAFKHQGWNKPVAQYEKYLKLQELCKIDVIVAELKGEIAGYLIIRWESDYIPFKENRIPEIVDLNVLQKFQRQGIGTELLTEAE